MRLRPDFRAAVSPIVNQVKKLRNQYLHINTGDGILQAILGVTRPKVGGAHVKNFERPTHFFLPQLVSFTVDGDPL